MTTERPAQQANRRQAADASGTALSPTRGAFFTGLSVVLCLFVLGEVNYPLLQPHARLALFALLGLAAVFVTVPLAKRWTTNRFVRAGDWVCLALVILVFGYVFVQTEPVFSRFWLAGQPLGGRAGSEQPLDYAMGFIGGLLVLEAARRVIGLTLPLLTLTFLLYGRFGAVLPDWCFPHRGYDWPRLMSQTVLHSQGVFGIALKVMCTYVFPFILFGAILEATGATQFIIDFARRVFRNSAGGPAKVAVLSSGLMGSLSGSAVANTATTGTFTIPMMKSAGFKPHIAGGIEAAASSGGALMPPIMGAGAYMMLEVVDPPVTYLQIIRAAILPAVLYYVALLIIVHLQARRAGAAAGQAVDPDAARIELSPACGVTFVLAFAVLLAALAFGQSPARGVTISLAAVLAVSACHRDTRIGGRALLEAMRRAGQGSLALIAAASCVGMILGVVTLTGVGSKLPAAILPLAHNNVIAALFLLMVSTIILGMGLPSAVCYLLMATFVGPVLGKLGIVPLAAHLFIFYFGMMSMVTPPVALAAYTAAAIAKADIMRTGLAAFRFALIGFVLPYTFVLNPSLLLVGPEAGGGAWLAVSNTVAVLAGTLLLAASMTGYFVRRVALPWRAALLLLAALLMLTRTGSTGVALRLIAVVAGAGVLLMNGRPAFRKGAVS